LKQSNIARQTPFASVVFGGPPEASMQITKVVIIFLLFLAAIASGQSQNKPPLTNEDIVKMVKGKFADSTILKAIEANDTTFDVSVSGLIALKDSGVSQTVIEAMLSAATTKGTSSATRAGVMTEKQPVGQESMEIASPPIHVYADKWETAELKECTTYGNYPFQLSCNEEKMGWPDSLFNLIIIYRQKGARSHDDAYGQAFWHEMSNSIDYQITFSGDDLARVLWRVENPWPDRAAIDSAIHRLNQVELPAKRTFWKCSEDFKRITCNFSGTEDPLLEKKKAAQ
jgi:hypothetical protein